jgi:uncharacterized phage protein gp47/JayE
MPLDVSGYVPAGALVPATVNELVQQAIADAQAGKWPDWIPREGQQEVILLELLAAMVAADSAQLNTVTGVLTEIILQQYGLTRSPGTASTVNVQFTTTASPTDVQIPAGSMVVLDPGQGLDPVTFSTDTPLVIPSGSTVGTVSATAVRVGSEVNGITAGTQLQVLSALPFVDAAQTASQVQSGTDPEDDASFLYRASPRLSRLVETLVRPDQYTAAAIETVGVTRAITIDKYDADAGGTPGSDLGDVTVAVAGPGGAGLSQLALEDLRATLQAQSYVLLTVHTINASVVSVAVSVTVVPQAGFTQAEVQTNVSNALAAYLNPDAWKWGTKVYRNELISLVDQVIGVDRVVDVTKLGTNTTGADYVLPGVAPLATVGTVVVTVNGG